MKTFSVRVTPELYEWLVCEAQANDRSLNQQVVMILRDTRYAVPDPESLIIDFKSLEKIIELVSTLGLISFKKEFMQLVNDARKGVSVDEHSSVNANQGD